MQWRSHAVLDSKYQPRARLLHLNECRYAIYTRGNVSHRGTSSLANAFKESNYGETREANRLGMIQVRKGGGGFEKKQSQEQVVMNKHGTGALSN